MISFDCSSGAQFDFVAIGFPPQTRIRHQQVVARTARHCSAASSAHRRSSSSRRCCYTSAAKAVNSHRACSIEANGRQRGDLRAKRLPKKRGDEQGQTGRAAGDQQESPGGSTSGGAGVDPSMLSFVC